MESPVFQILPPPNYLNKNVLSLLLIGLICKNVCSAECEEVSISV